MSVPFEKCLLCGVPRWLHEWFEFVDRFILRRPRAPFVGRW